MAMSADKIKELKSMIVKAKTAPINMAVCFGKKPAGAEIVTDKIRKPEALGREAKSAGETAKVAFGTLSVSGTGATFTCEKDAPTGLGKHLKKFFKLNDLPVMSVEIIGPDGNPVVEADEDEESEGEGNAAQGQTGENDADADVAASAEADARDGLPNTNTDDDQNENEEQAETGSADNEANPAKAAWEAAWSGAEAKVADAIAKGDETAAKVTKLRDFVLGKVGADDFEAALKGLQPLLALASAAPSQTETAPKLDPNDLVRRLGTIKPQLAALQGPIAQKLGEMFQAAVGQVKAGALPAAADGIGQIETALKRIGEAKQGDTADPKFAGMSKAVEALRAQVTSKTAGDAHDAMMAILDTVAEDIGKSEAEKALAGLKRVQDGLKLQEEVDRLQPLVARAASSGMVADVNALNNLFNMVVHQVPANDHAKAMANLARVEAMITDGVGQGKSTFEAEVAPDVKPFATARLSWMSTRSTLKDELSKLEAEIGKVLEQAGLAGEIQVGGALLSYIDALDVRLETKLDEIVNAEAGEKRESLKSEARNLISEYQGVLDRDFFKDVDNSNGFMSVSVTSTAQSMLNNLAGVLA